MRGYYCDLECGRCDSDDDDENNYYNSPEYNVLYENMKKICLTPRKPIVIYENKLFLSPKLENKYLPIIQDKINKQRQNKDARFEDSGIFTSMDQILKIVKKEEKYDPYYNH
jgi:hypothetical protein